MENVSSLTPKKSRSYGACISSGYDLFKDNFKSIFKHTWIWMLLFALGMALVNVPSFSVILAGLVVTVVACCILYGRVYNMLRVHYETDVFPAKNAALDRKITVKNIKRMIVMYIWMFIFMIPLIVAFVLLLGMNPNSPAADPAIIRNMLIFCAVAIVYCVFFLPLIYTAFHYIVTYKYGGFFSVLKATFGKGLRYWGFIFITYLLLGIMITVICTVVTIPMVILSSALQMDTIGTMSGDPSGLPTWFWYIFVITGAITYFIIGYTSVYSCIVGYYVGGSIEQKVKEKQHYDDSVSNLENQKI